jgi:hypothetical protein
MIATFLFDNAASGLLTHQRFQMRNFPVDICPA